MRTIIPIIFLILFQPCSAQDSTVSSIRSLRVSYDNDLFNATDRYYTQGIYLELQAPAIARSPISLILLGFPNSLENQYSLYLEQDVFTPRSIRRNSIYFGERPYSAVLFISHKRTSFSGSQKLVSRIDLGVIGPAALGKEQQTAIHTALDNLLPLGWQHQIRNDLVLNYQALASQLMFQGRFLNLISDERIRLGTLYDDVSAGLQVRTGVLKPFIESERLPQETRFHFYFFIRGAARLSGYNASLQGGLFNRSSPYTLPAKDLNRVIAEAQAGIVLGTKKFNIEYVNHYTGAEFKGGLDHGWGHLSLQWRF
jgi:hypothetical protein